MTCKAPPRSENSTPGYTTPYADDAVVTCPLARQRDTAGLLPLPARAVMRCHVDFARWQKDAYFGDIVAHFSFLFLAFAFEERCCVTDIFISARRAEPADIRAAGARRDALAARHADTRLE